MWPNKNGSFVQVFFSSVHHIFNLIQTAAKRTRIRQRTTRITIVTRITRPTRITREKNKRAIRTGRATRNDFGYGC